VPTGFPDRTKMLEQVSQPADAATAKQLGIPVGTVVTLPMIQRWQQQGAGPGLVGPAGAAAGGAAPPGGGGAPAAPATGAPAPPVPSPIAGGGVYRQRQPATPQAPAVAAPAPAPTPPVPAAASPAIPAGGGAAVAAPAVAMPAPGATAAAPSTGGLRPVVSGPPAGFPQDLDLYQKGAQGIAAHVQNAQNLDTAIKALDLTKAGPSSASVHNIYAFLKEQGVAPKFVDNDVTQWAIANKAMNAFIANKSQAGGTDLSTHITQDSNANMSIDQDAARHVMLQNLGWENQAIAMQHLAPQGGVGMHDHISRFPTDTVPEAFAWNRYTQAERTAITNAAKQNGTYDKLAKSLKMAVDDGLVPRPSTGQQPAAAAPATAPQQAAPSTPGRQSMANPLAYSRDPGTNLLLASRANALAPQQRNLLAMG
jgi:hypothetical protein